MSAPRTSGSLEPDRPNYGFIGTSLVLLVGALGTDWHFMTTLGYIDKPFPIVLIGSAFMFTLAWVVTAGIGCLFGNLSTRNPSYPKHLEYYLQASLWMVVYHLLIIWFRAVSEYKIPSYVGWILQPAVYTLIAVTAIKRRQPQP